jgi:hypothetical protein
MHLRSRTQTQHGAWSVQEHTVAWCSCSAQLTLGLASCSICLVRYVTVHLADTAA